MGLTGIIYGVDLGVSSGVAEGRAGEKPRSYSVVLKKPDEHRAVAFSNLIAFLDERFRAERPQLLAKEAMLNLRAFKNLGSAEATVRLTAGLHAIVEGMCGRYGIPWRDVHDATFRKHFLGRARMGTREETKAAVVSRCHLLGVMPRDCTDEDRADAIAVHDWACATFGRRSVSMADLFLFGEEQAIRETGDHRHGRSSASH